MARPLLTSESASQVITALHRRHAGMLRDERFELRARLEQGTVVATLELARSDRSSHYVMEAAKAVPENGALDLEQTLDLCLDFLDWYLGEFFREQRELLLPLDWQPHKFGDFEVLARGDLRNPILEDAADAWLRGERPEVPGSMPGTLREDS
jgi:hypothetical protein